MGEDQKHPQPIVVPAPGRRMEALATDEQLVNAIDRPLKGNIEQLS